MMLIVQLIPSRLSWRSRDEEKNFDQKVCLILTNSDTKQGWIGISCFMKSLKESIEKKEVLIKIKHFMYYRFSNE